MISNQKNRQCHHVLTMYTTVKSWLNRSYYDPFVGLALQRPMEFKEQSFEMTRQLFYSSSRIRWLVLNGRQWQQKEACVTWPQASENRMRRNPFTQWKPPWMKALFIRTALQWDHDKLRRHSGHAVPANLSSFICWTWLYYNVLISKDYFAHLCV